MTYGILKKTEREVTGRNTGETRARKGVANEQVVFTVMITKRHTIVTHITENIRVMANKL